MKKKFTKITDLPALLVFGVFAVCVLAVLLYGAKIYQNLVRRGEESFRMRTATQYVSTRIQQAEHVSTADFSGCEALALREEIDGRGYVTYVYCYDGFLRELFCAENAALSPQDGEKILPVEKFHLSMEVGLLTVTVDERQVKLQLRGKEEERP